MRRGRRTSTGGPSRIRAFAHSCSKTVRRPGRVAQRRGPFLTLGTTPLAGRFQREGSIAWPMLVEASLVVGAIAILFPWFGALAMQETGRDGRFANSGLTVGSLPNPILPKLCASFAADADPLLRDTLCRGVTPTRIAEPVDRLPRALVDAKTQAKRAISLYRPDDA